MIALLPTFNNGFGVLSVRGRNRSPFPPAINTASIGKYERCVLRLMISTICFFHLI